MSLSCCFLSPQPKAPHLLAVPILVLLLHVPPTKVSHLLVVRLLVLLLLVPPPQKCHIYLWFLSFSCCFAPPRLLHKSITLTCGAPPCLVAFSSRIPPTNHTYLQCPSLCYCLVSPLTNASHILAVPLLVLLLGVPPHKFITLTCGAPPCLVASCLHLLLSSDTWNAKR